MDRKILTQMEAGLEVKLVNLALFRTKFIHNQIL